MAQSVTAFAPQAEGCEFSSQPRQAYVVKRGGDSSTTKWPRVTK